MTDETMTDAWIGKMIDKQRARERELHSEIRTTESAIECYAPRYHAGCISDDDEAEYHRLRTHLAQLKRELRQAEYYGD